MENKFSFCNIRGLHLNLDQVHFHLQKVASTNVISHGNRKSQNSGPRFHCSVRQFHNLVQYKSDVSLCIYLGLHLGYLFTKKCMYFLNNKHFDQLLEYLYNTIDSIISTRRSSEILFLGDFNIHNQYRLDYSFHTSRAEQAAETFTVNRNTSQLVDFSTGIPDNTSIWIHSRSFPYRQPWPSLRPPQFVALITATFYFTNQS